MRRDPGCVIVADELVEDEFTAPASPEEQCHHAWSVVPSARHQSITSTTQGHTQIAPFAVASAEVTGRVERPMHSITSPNQP